MLRLNLLPASYRQKGTVKAAAILVLVVWIVALGILGLYAYWLENQIGVQVAAGVATQADRTAVDAYTAAKATYEGNFAGIKPETDFLNQVVAEPVQIAQIMHDVQHAIPDGVVLENYTITPGATSLALKTLALDYVSYNRLRMNLLMDPDFVGVPQISGLGGGGATAAGGASTGGYPGGSAGMPGPGGYPGMGGSPGPGMGSSSGGQSGAFDYPQDRYPHAITVDVTANLVHTVAVPAFSPGGGSGGGGAAGGGGGYPGSGGGYPGGGGGYPGGGGGYPPTGPPSAGASVAPKS